MSRPPIYIGRRHVVEGSSGNSHSSLKQGAIYYKATNAPKYAQLDIGIVGNKKAVLKNLKNNDFHIVSMLHQTVELPHHMDMDEVAYEDVPKCCYPVFDLLDDLWENR